MTPRPCRHESCRPTCCRTYGADLSQCLCEWTWGPLGSCCKELWSALLHLGCCKGVCGSGCSAEVGLLEGCCCDLWLRR